MNNATLQIRHNTQTAQQRHNPAPARQPGAPLYQDTTAHKASQEDRINQAGIRALHQSNATTPTRQKITNPTPLTGTIHQPRR